MRFFTLFFCCFLGLFATTSKLKVAVSIDPQAFFVKKIGGDSVETIILVPKNKNPEHYEPLFSQAKLLKDSDVYFGIGLEFETKWKERFLSINPKMDFIDLSHYHNQDFHHKHDAHIWLSIVLAKEQAREIFEVLAKKDIKNQQKYKQNLEAFLEEIEVLDKKIKNLFEQKNTQKTFLVYHPAFEYFSKEYNLEELAIEMHNKETKIKHLQKLNQMIKQKNLKVIYKQPQFSTKQVELLAKEHHLKISTLDPFAFDWLENMWDIAQKIAYEK
ncbi:cation ABC transporter substrate-binding protein [Helicobacter anseris]|uniref:Cation ABC transporter substrate-binding protein n=1 Tax=Helicobacter anseris TaxID=375926 RepID=A0A3D8JAB2_9HELI|nr:zinc ABC transporter substrate-binding protein [Helicobacter anseris]RDU74240.1 cation ABC transporter substrate-binding protein [Helicobacter anseris]